MSVSDGAVRLWSPPGAATVIPASVVLATALGVSGVCLWFAGWGIVEPWRSQSTDVWEVLAGLGVAAIFLFAVYVGSIASYKMLRFLRLRYWLVGTVLIEQRVVRKPQFDLSAVDVEPGLSDKGRLAAQYVKVRVPDTGAETKLPVTWGKDVMAPQHLLRVADALTAGRDRAADEHVFVIADRLRRLAEDPATRIDPEVPASGEQGASDPGVDANGELVGETGWQWLLLVAAVTVGIFVVVGSIGLLLGLGWFSLGLVLLVLMPALRVFPTEFKRRVWNRPDKGASSSASGPSSAEWSENSSREHGE